MGEYFIDDLRVELAQPICIQPPNTFSMVAPIIGGFLVGPDANFDWTDSSNATSYSIVVSANADLSDPIVNETGLTQSQFTLSGLANGVYYFDVKAINAGGEFRRTGPFAFLGDNAPSRVGDIADDFGTLMSDSQVSFGDFLALLGLIGPCP